MKQEMLDLTRLFALAEFLPRTDFRDWVPSVRMAAERLRANVWQPIESAPLDGTRVLLWMEPHDAISEREQEEPCVVIGYYVVWSERSKREGMRDGWSWYGPVRCKPTHWRPLPAGPEAQP